MNISKTKNNNKNIRKNIKKTQKNKQNAIKKRIFNNIYKDFYDWLSGIQEDEPMPFEVKNIYFIVEFLQNDIALSYSGDENLLNVFDYGFYSPLEGQYFDCNALKEIANDVFIKKSISQNKVYALLKKIVFDVSPKLWFLKNKHIFFGIRYSKIIV